jgi:transcriptional regulator of arginine metabolism
MKASRHARIKEIIENQTIETQEELAEALRKKGIEVTQATVSRDIKELMLIKVPTGDGRYRYAFPPEQNIIFSQSRLERAFQDSVIAMDQSLNIIVIRTVPGMAQAVAYAIDSTKWPEIIGTVGGDDTIFIVVKPPEEAGSVLARFRALL